MRKIYVLLILLLLTPLLCSAKVEKFNDWVYDSDILTIDDHTFTFDISSDLESIRVKQENRMSLVKKDDCSSDKYVRICFNETFSDDIYGEKRVLAQIYFYSPNLTIERSVDASAVEVGDEIDFTVKVTNDGDLETGELSYTDSFPKGIQILKVTGDCEKGLDNSVIHTGNLGSSDDFSCRYTIIPLTEVDVKLEAQVDYFDWLQEEKIFSSLINIKSSALFSVTATFNATEPEAGEEFRLYLNLSNIVKDNLKFEKFTVKLPQEMAVGYTNMEREEGVYVWDGTLSENGSKEFFFIITPEDGGNFEILYDAYLEKNDKKYQLLDNNIDFEIEIEALKLSSTLDDKKGFDSGNEVYLAFWAANPNIYMDAYDVSAKISTTLFESPTISKELIKSNGTALLYKTSFVSPDLSSSTKYSIELKVNYTTKFGTEKTVKKTWKATVGPEKGISIKKTLSKSSVTEGDDVTVTVVVTNKKKSPVYNINLREIFPKNISRNGKTTTFIDMLEEDESETAYTYTITAPKIASETTITINTTLTYQETAGDDIQTKNASDAFKTIDIKVKPKKLKLSISKSGDSTTIDLGELVKTTYKIENKDTETAHDIMFVFGSSTYTDIVDEYTYYLERLEPGEVVSFQREVLRPKKTGKYKTGTTTVNFLDPDGNKFNYTLDTLTVDVKERTLLGPAVVLKKLFDKSKYDEGELVNVTLTIENVGDEGTDVNIRDGVKSFDIYVPAQAEKNITYQFTASENSAQSGSAYAFINYRDKEYRAHAPASITVKTAAEDTAILSSGEVTEAAAPENASSTDEGVEEEKTNIFVRIWSQILSFFKRT